MLPSAAMTVSGSKTVRAYCTPVSSKWSAAGSNPPSSASTPNTRCPPRLRRGGGDAVAGPAGGGTRARAGAARLQQAAGPAGGGHASGGDEATGEEGTTVDALDHGCLPPSGCRQRSIAPSHPTAQDNSVATGARRVAWEADALGPRGVLPVPRRASPRPRCAPTAPTWRPSWQWAERGGAEGPDVVDRLLLRRYLAYLGTRRYARATLARKAAALRCYFAWQRRRGALAVDPARRLAAPGGGSRLPRVLDRTELDTMLDRPGRRRGGDPDGGSDDLHDALSLRDDAVLELLYGCGLRVAELCGLDVGDVDVRGLTVTVLGKGDRQRRVPMHDRCAGAVALWLRRGRQALVTELSAARGGVPQPPGGQARAPRRPAHPRPAFAGPHPPPRPAPQLRHPPPRRGGGPAGRPGAAGARQSADHAGLHSCE